MKAGMKAQGGFTLIEIMIVTVIIAILASIAVPSYSDYVQRGKITEAITNLSAGRVRMEQFFQDSRSYVGNPNVLGCTNAGDPITSFQDTKYFTYSCTTLTPATYTLTATGVVGEGMSGFSYAITDANVKTSTITAPATGNGWATPANNCWTTKKGGKC